MNEVKSPKKPLLYYYFVAMLLVMLFNFIAMPWISEHQIKDVDYNTFVTMTEQGEVGRVEIQEQSNRILFTSSDEKTVYKTAMVPDDGLVQRLLDAGVSTTGEEIEQTSTLVSILAWVLPIIIFVALGQYMSRKMMEKMGGGGNSMMFNMGKSNAKVYVKSAEGIKFDDVAGEDEAKENLTEVVNYLHDPSKYQEIGASMPKGILLVGPPGTGKTMLAKAVAGESNVPFFSISGSEFVEMFVGMGASKVRDLFKQAKEKAPCIVFIDEIDAIGQKRSGGQYGGNDEREQTLNQLLVEMDGFTGKDNVIVIAATNRRDILDPALLRPGRFDRQIVVGYPDVKGREQILKVHTKSKSIGPDVDLTTIAKSTVGFTGADLENLVNEACLLAARKNKKAITMDEIQEATIKVIAGPEKKSHKVTPKEKRLTAFHEAGHAVCTYYCDHQDKVHQVSIIPRGMAGGYTMSLPEQDKSFVSKKEMEENIITLLGGRVAEQLVLDDISTGASNDLERATSTARSMVTRYGFSEKLGPIVYGNDQNEVFLGRDLGSSRDYSDRVAGEIDDEVRNIVEKAYDKATAILQMHMDQLELLAKYLMIHEKIEKDDFETLMQGKMDPSQFEETPAEPETSATEAEPTEEKPTENGDSSAPTEA
mgnify:CR=1 FL=1